MFEQNIENPLFEGRMKATNNNGVGFAHHLCPSDTPIFGFERNSRRGKEGNKMAFQQVGISERTHKKRRLLLLISYSGLRYHNPNKQTGNPRQVNIYTHCAKCAVVQIHYRGHPVAVLLGYFKVAKFEYRKNNYKNVYVTACIFAKPLQK